MTPARKLARSRSSEEVEGWLHEKLAGLLGVAPSGLTGQINLTELGLDSLEIERLLAELEDWLDASVDASILLGASTLRDLADSIVRPHNGYASAILPLERNDDFSQFVNPALGARLRRLRLDKRFVRGEGCLLYDDDGREYLDFVGAYGALPFGHNPPAILEAVRATFESQEPSFVQPSSLVAASALAARLVEIAPEGLSHVTFANSGTEAVEAALKLCRAVSGRPGILSCNRSFHGKTLGSLAATGNESYRLGYLPANTEVDFVPYGDVEALRDALRRRGGYYAGFIVEPIQGEGGVVVPPPGYLKKAQALCRETGTLFVLDEVQTGLGRTGRLFAAEHDALQPDVLVLAKALGGGVLPIGACLSRAEAHSEHFGLTHSSTFAGSSLACRVGLASLELLERDDSALLQHVCKTAEYLRAGLEQLRQRFPKVLLEVRGRGLMLGLRLANVPWCQRSLLGVAAEQGMLGALLASHLLNRHAVRVAPTLNHNNVVRVQPPLVATSAHCDRFLSALDASLRLLEAGDSGAIFEGIERAVPERGAGSVVGLGGKGSRPGSNTRTAPVRFAFIGHPLDRQALSDFDPSLTRVSSSSIGILESLLAAEAEPFVATTAQVKAKTGSSTFGDFIVVPHTAAALMALPEAAATAVVQAAVDLAIKRGASLIGLGGYSSVVTRNGLSVHVPEGVLLTSGNSFTAAAGVEGLCAALEEHSSQRAPWPSLAILGACGSIGKAVGVLASERFESLVLLGNPAAGRERGLTKLRQAAHSLCRSVITRQSEHAYHAHSLAKRICQLDAEFGGELERILSALLADGRLRLDVALQGRVTRTCTAIATATSSPEPLLSSEHLAENCVVCDLSKPSNVHPDVAITRPDVRVLEAGLIDVPGGIDLNMFGLSPGHVYACMAETMLLALEGPSRHFGLGAALRLDDIEHLARLSRIHGFEVSRHSSSPPSLARIEPALERVR